VLNKYLDSSIALKGLLIFSSPQQMINRYKIYIIVNVAIVPLLFEYLVKDGWF
jgi:hypothetical protein